MMLKKRLHDCLEQLDLGFVAAPQKLAGPPRSIHDFPSPVDDSSVPGRVSPHWPTNPTDFDGMVAPESITWRINGEVTMLLGWTRAILLQIAHPLVAQGVADHSQFRNGPLARWRRLQHTLGSMLDLTFGTRDQAWQVARFIDGIHGRTVGQLTGNVGTFPDGALYQARDPALLRWVWATLIDSFLRTHELMVGPIAPAEKDLYCREATALGPMFGVPDGYLPSNHHDLLDYLQSLLTSGEIQVGPVARQLANDLLAPPVPIIGGPVVELFQLPTAGLLPERIRHDYGLPWDARREKALIGLAVVSRALHRRLPAGLHRWPIAERRARAARRHSPGKA